MAGLARTRVEAGLGPQVHAATVPRRCVVSTWEMDAAGDDEALGRLYEEYMPKLMDWLQKRQEVRSPSRQYAYLAANIASDLAAEIASHVWEQVLGDLRRGKQLDDFWAYLIGVAKIRLRRLACGPRRRVDDVTVREEAEALESHAAAGPRPEEVSEARCMHLMYQHLYGMLLGYEAAPNQTLCFAFVQLLGTRPRSLVEERRGSELDALADAFLEEMVAAGCPLPEAAVPTLRDRLSLPIEAMRLSARSLGVYEYLRGRRSGATVLDEWFGPPDCGDGIRDRVRQAVESMSEERGRALHARLGRSRESIPALRPLLGSMQGAQAEAVSDAYLSLCADEVSRWCDSLLTGIRSRLRGRFAAWERGESIDPDLAELFDSLGEDFLGGDPGSA